MHIYNILFNTCNNKLINFQIKWTLIKEKYKLEIAISSKGAYLNIRLLELF